MNIRGHHLFCTYCFYGSGKMKAEEFFGIKNAILIKEMNPEAKVHILYRDLMMYGVENEDQLRKAKELGVRFVKYDPKQPPVVEENKVTVFHQLMGTELEIPQEMVVLSTPLVGTEDGVKVGNLFRAGLDKNKFFLEAHVKLRPLDCGTDGIFICGSAHYPKDVRESIMQALEQTRWNKTAAAKLLGLSLRQLRYRLQKLNIE